MTKDDFMEFSSDNPDAVLIGGNEEEHNKFLPAIIGFDRNNESVVYSREKLIECYMKECDMTYDDAAEWIEYNVDRSLPYIKSHAPIIMDELVC